MGLFHSHLKTVLLSVGVVTSNPALAADDVKAVPPITVSAARGNGPFLGPWIEARFQEMIKSCLGSTLKMKRLKKDPLFDVSAVPNGLRGPLQLDNGGPKILEQNGKAVAYLFGTVYTEAELQTLRPANGNFYLSSVFDDAPDYVKMPRMNGAAYAQSCATSMSAAIAANAGFTFPIASIKGGFDADYDANSGYSLNLVQATFKSPTLVAYSGATTTDQSPFNAAMLFFDWYREHPERIETANKLLDSFQGVAIYNQMGFKRKTTFDTNAAYKVGLPLIGSSNGDVITNAQWLTGFNAQSYWVAIYRRDDGALDAVTVAMPSVDDVIAKAGATGSVVIDRAASGSDFTLYNRTARSITYRIERLPTRLCQADWRVVAQNLPVNVATVSKGKVAVVAGADGWPACNISVTFQPAKAMPLNVSRDLALTFELPVKPEADAKKISLAAEVVSMSALEKPHLGQISNDQRPKFMGKSTAGGTRSSIRWTAQYQLTDQGATVADKGIDIDYLVFACASEPENMPTRAIDLRAGGASRVVELTLNAEWNGDFEVSQPNLTYTPCTLSGDIVYTLTNTKKVTKEFPTLRFLYPVPPPG